MTQISYIDFRIRPVDDTTSVDLQGTDAAGYTRVYGDQFTEDRSLERLISEMSANNVVGLMQAEWEDDDPQAVNERVHRAISAHPDRLVGGIATTDPRTVGALDTLKAAHDGLGLKGWNFQPGFLKVAITDERCRPLFDYCQSNGHPVAIHTGINFSASGPISLGHPSSIDHIACEYPELTIICNHGAWPWVTEMLAVMWKHPRVFADFGAVSPKRMVGPKGGWEPAAHWMNSMVSNQILLATDWPMMRYSRLLSELPLLELDDASLERYTKFNAAALIDSIWQTTLLERTQPMTQLTEADK